MRSRPEEVVVMRPPEGSEGPGGGVGEKADTARAAASEVASSAKERARSLAGETRSETAHVADDVQVRLREEIENRTRKASGHLRQWSRDLESMAGHEEPESPVGDVVYQVAEGGRRAADFLEERGVDGLVEETRDFARRNPVVFLVGAAVAGFVLGRALKASTSGERGDEGDGSAGDTRQAEDRESASLPRQATPTAGETVPPYTTAEGLGRVRGSEGG